MQNSSGRRRYYWAVKNDKSGYRLDVGAQCTIATTLDGFSLCRLLEVSILLHSFHSVDLSVPTKHANSALEIMY